MVVVVAVPCSWLAVEMKKAREQKDAVAAIKKGGRSYEYHWRFDANGRDAIEPQPPVSEWLWLPLGIDFFSEVVRMGYMSSVDATQFADADVQHLKGLSQLRFLALSPSQITDAGLRKLTGLRRLETLILDQTRVTDSGLECLLNFPKLNSLSLCDTQITDAGLRSLANLPIYEN